MLFILFGTMAKMGYESRQYLERQGFEQITKLSYAPPETAMVTRNGKRTYATLEEVLRCDFTYTHNDFTVGFNKDQIIDAVTGRKDCLLSLSANSIDFIEQLKLAYGDYVTTIFVYTNRQLLQKIVDGLEDITEAEKALRLSTGKRIRELFLEKRSVFDEVVLYDGENSLYNLQSLYTQYDTIIRKARRTQQLLNNRNYVELPYSGPDGYIFVSYAHADESAVYPVLAMLQRNHCRVWYDRGIKGGANWRQLLAEKINENGLGNGISLILFFNIIASLPKTLESLIGVCIEGFHVGVWNGIGGIGFGLLVILSLLAMTFFVIFVTGSERRIPVQYAKRVVGRKMYGGQSTNLPLQLNMSGVMPVIFASSIVSLPTTILVLCGVSATTKGFWGGFYRVFDANGWVYPILLFVLIIAFAYFYITISFSPVEVANNLKKNGGMIPGIRQGRPTAEYIARILSKITLMGALFLSIIAIVPIIARPLVIQPILTGVMGGELFAAQLASSFTFGGTSLLIVVGIALETARELEAQLTMRNHKGFLS